MERYLVFPAAPTENQMEHLRGMLSLLESGQPIMPKLCRDTTVLKVSATRDVMVVILS